VQRSFFTSTAAKAFWWLALSLPGLILALQWARESDPWLADYVAATGLWSARFLILALCLTPLQQLLGHRPWLASIIRHRRAIGVGAFFYTLIHIALYAADMADLPAIADEAAAPAMVAGWLAFASMVVPAMISTDSAMRQLGPAWKRLQRFAYPAALLTLVHWALVHDGFGEALLHFTPLVLLQCARLARHLNSPPKQRTIR
jgi:sulfoxide reductase heme-binding subunit YedZ